MMTHKSDYHALVVDDEDMIRRLVSRALAGESISSDGAADGAEALKRFAKKEYDLVVTDLRMPNLHGHNLAVDLLESDRPPCIFVLTGVAEVRLTEDLLARGALGVKTKPVNFKMFARDIRAKMDTFRASASRAKNAHKTAGQDSSHSLVTIGQIESYLLSEMKRFPPELLAELIGLEVTGESSIPQDVKKYVDLLSRPSPYAISERRKMKRINKLFPVQCIAYDDAFNIHGDPFQAYIRDLSMSGVGIVSRCPLKQNYLAVGWSNPKGMRVRGFIKIHRCLPQKSLYNIGGQFVNDF